MVLNCWWYEVINTSKHNNKLTHNGLRLVISLRDFKRGETVWLVLWYIYDVPSNSALKSLRIIPFLTGHVQHFLVEGKKKIPAANSSRRKENVRLNIQWILLVSIENKKKPFSLFFLLIKGEFVLIKSVPIELYS